jgi:hypothetical protein
VSCHLQVERSTYVLFTSLTLLILYWRWLPIHQPVWTVHNPIAAAVLDGIFWLGWVVLVVSTFLLSHFELFGLSQMFTRLFGKELSEAKFRAPLQAERGCIDYTKVVTVRPSCSDQCPNTAFNGARGAQGDSRTSKRL